MTLPAAAATFTPVPRPARAPRRRYRRRPESPAALQRKRVQSGLDGARRTLGKLLYGCDSLCNEAVEMLAVATTPQLRNIFLSEIAALARAGLALGKAMTALPDLKPARPGRAPRSSEEPSLTLVQRLGILELEVALSFPSPPVTGRGKRGAPAGNRNALKTGCHTAAMKRHKKRVGALLIRAKCAVTFAKALKNKAKRKLHPGEGRKQLRRRIAQKKRRVCRAGHQRRLAYYKRTMGRLLKDHPLRKDLMKGVPRSASWP